MSVIDDSPRQPFEMNTQIKNEAVETSAIRAIYEEAREAARQERVRELMQEVPLQRFAEYLLNALPLRDRKPVA